MPEILSVGEAGDTTDTDSVLKMLTTILLRILALICTKGAGGMMHAMYQISTACISTENTSPTLMVLSGMLGKDIITPSNSPR